jgi:hypothetical protein
LKNNSISIQEQNDHTGKGKGFPRSRSSSVVMTWEGKVPLTWRRVKQCRCFTYCIVKSIFRCSNIEIPVTRKQGQSEAWIQFWQGPPTAFQGPGVQKWGGRGKGRVPCNHRRKVKASSTLYLTSLPVVYSQSRN